MSVAKIEHAPKSSLTEITVHNAIFTENRRFPAHKQKDTPPDGHVGRTACPYDSPSDFLQPVRYPVFGSTTSSATVFPLILLPVHAIRLSDIAKTERTFRAGITSGCNYTYLSFSFFNTQYPDPLMAFSGKMVIRPVIFIPSLSLRTYNFALISKPNNK